MSALDKELLHSYRTHPATETERMADASDVCEICRRRRREPKLRTCHDLQCKQMQEALDEIRTGAARRLP